MPRKSVEEAQQRFADLLGACLTKSGRKQSELAQACAYDPSLISKILKGRAKTNLGVFLKEMVPFLIANGGLTHARQAIEMTALLGGELNETDLHTIANAAERLRDPLQSQSYFRDRANTFRQTISSALSDSLGLMATRTGFGLQSAQAIATEPEPPEVKSVNLTAEPDSVVVTQSQDWPRLLAEWQAIVREFLPMARGDELEPDEVIAKVLDWESHLADPVLADAMWNWLGKHRETLRQRERLEFVLKRFDGNGTWNQLEWEWLDWMTAETARRSTGQAQLSPRQTASFITDLGQIAFEAVKQTDGQTTSVTVNLNNIRSKLPVTQGADWEWLRHIAKVGPVSIIVADGICQFALRDEAEFLAAQYLLAVASDDDIEQMVKNAGRPFGVLRQMMRILHFTGKDESARAIVEGLMAISDVIPLRYLDAACLLVACQAPETPTLRPLWVQVEAFLCEEWMEVDAPEYRAAIARVMGEMQSGRFLALLQTTLSIEPTNELFQRDVISALAEMGGPQAFMLMEQGALSRVLTSVHSLPVMDAVELLTRLATRATADYAEHCAAVSALEQLESVPALRALQHLAQEAPHPKTRRYAETRLEFGDSPAQIAMLARAIEDAAQTPNDPTLWGLVLAAKAMLPRAIHYRKLPPARTLARALARIWIDPQRDESIRVEAALGLMAARAWPAFEIVLMGLPLVDGGPQPSNTLTESLLLAVTSPSAKPLLQRALEGATRETQRAVLTHCLESLEAATLAVAPTPFDELSLAKDQPIETVEVLQRQFQFDPDPFEQMQALDSLVRLNEPGLFELLVDVACSAQEPQVCERASYHLAVSADLTSLLQLPPKLKSTLYQAAVARDVRFLRERFRQKAVFANAIWSWV